MSILKRSVPVGTLLAAIVLSVFWIGIGSLIVEGARVRDFLNLYTGSSLARDGDFSQLFDRETQLRRGANRFFLHHAPCAARSSGGHSAKRLRERASAGRSSG